MSPVVVLLLAGVISFLFRVLPITVLSRVDLSNRLRRLLGYAAPAAIAAMVGAVVVGGQPVTEVLARVPVAGAAVATAVAALRFKGVAIPVAAGLCTATVLTALG